MIEMNEFEIDLVDGAGKAGDIADSGAAGVGAASVGLAVAVAGGAVLTAPVTATVLAVGALAGVAAYFLTD